MKLGDLFFRKVFGVLSLLFFGVASLSSQVPAYLCELRNDDQVDSRTFEFDVYLLRTGATAFELSSIEFGINVNTGLRNGGTITVTIVNGSSELNAAQIPVDSQFSFDNATNCISMTASSLPGAGNGSVISGTGNGTRVGRIRITNSSTFGLVRPDLTWNFSSSNGLVTNVNAYVSGVSTDITVQSSHTISNLINGVLVPAPAQFDVTGGGAYCSGGSGVAVGLSGSESGVTYTLIRDGADLTPTVAGTGGAISFGNQTIAGTYTVRGTNAAGSTTMNGSAVVTINTPPGQPGTISGPSTPCPGTSGLTYEVAEVTGATSYTWGVPSGWLINSGQGTRTVSVTSGTAGGTISVYASNTCGDGTARTLAVSVGTNSVAPTGVTITNNNTCAGTGKVLTVAGGSLGTGAVWEWFSGSCGGTSAGTGSSITVDPAAGTSTTYYVRASGTCNTTACANGTVTVPANVGTPAVPVPSASVLCQGTASITVSTTAANATSYNWSITGTDNTMTGTGATATANFASTFSGIATISATANGCGGPTGPASTNVTVRPTPTALISGTTSVCQNAPSPQVTFTNPQALPVTVTYNIGGSNEANINVGASGTATLSIPTGTTGTFAYNLVSVSYQTAPSCSNPVSGTATVTVIAAPSQPTITADGPTTFCQDENVVLTSSSATSYEWSTGAATQSITVTEGGNYTVRVTNAAGCQSVWSGTTVVSVNPLPSRPSITPSGTVGICAGSSRTLSSSTGTSYLWSNGETSQVISVSTAGSYTVQVTNSYGCLSQPSLATTVTINPLPVTPTITASGSTTICAGDNVILTSSESTLYLWSTGASTRSITVSTAGDYWVRVTDANGCQSAQSALTKVTVNLLPSEPTVGTIAQPTCSVSTGSVALSGLPATGTWILARNTGGTDITGSGATYTVTGLPEGSHTFTVTNANGCTSPPSAVVTIIKPPAVPTAPVMGTVTQPTCAVTTGSVGISGLPQTGTWTLTRNPGGVEVTGSGTTFTASGIPAGTFTFTVTNADGCISPASTSITVTAPLPVPAAPTQTVDCSLGFNQAVVTVTGPTGAGYSYQLDGGTFQTGTTFSNVTNGTHQITVRNSSGCTTTGAEFSVNCGCVNPPLLNLSATSGSTCGVIAVTVTGNTFGGSATGITITENGGGTVTPASSTTSPFSFTYTPVAGDAGKVVVITVTTNNPVGGLCVAASANYSLTVNAIPVAPVPGTVTHPSCSLPTGSVVLNSLPASGDWTVTRNPGGQATTGSGTSTTISGLAPGTYTFTVTNVLGCISAASANVVINTQPDTPSAPVVGDITQPTCALSTGSVVLSGLPATGNWSLTRIPGNVIISGSGDTRTVSSIPPGTYTYTVTNAAGCVSSPSAEVVVNPQPVTPNAPILGTITHPTCDLSTGTIVLENMPETGEWVLVRYPGGTSLTGTGSSTTISSLPEGVYNFTVRNADGCTSPVSANAIINAQPPTPSAPVVGTITHPTFLVATGSVVLSGLPSTGTWTLIRYPDGFTSQGTGTTRTVSGLEPGTYNFAVTNSAGCTSANTGDVVINARPGAPVVVINNPPAICENETTDLTLPAVTAGSDANLTFTYWTDQSATQTYATPQTATAGTYYIMGTSTAGYYTIKPVVVTADEIPVADAGDDQTLEYLFGTTLSARIPEIGTGMWALVSGTGDLFNATAYSTQVSGLSVGENVFSWTVTNGACDPVTDLIVVMVNNLIVPTLITPNQDGRNDFFVLRGRETLGRTELIIIDRRGLKVYENNDYQDDWNGLDYNSNPLPDDTYFWIIRAENGVTRSGYIVVRQ